MTDEPSERVRLALVGCGRIADHHLDGAERVGARIEVTAVVDPDPRARERLAARTGAVAFATLDEALAVGSDRFDAVDVMVPHDLHEPVAIHALDAGKHVLLEKPMAIGLEACQRILASAERAGAVFLVAEQSQYWPDVVAAAERVAAGAIGRPLFARANYRDPLVLPTDLGPDGRSVPWRYQLERAGGGLAIDGGAHWIRPLRMMLGEIDDVIAVTGRHVDQMEGESWLQALLRFRSGITATFEAFASPHPMAPSELFRVTGTEGDLVIPGPGFVDAELWLHGKGRPDGECVLSIPRGRADSYGLEVADFADVILDGSAPAAGPEVSIGELRTALAIYRSVDSGRWEPVWD